MGGGGMFDSENCESRAPDDREQEHGNERKQNLRFSGTAQEAMK